MVPSEIISVRLFKEHIAEYLPDYSSVDDQNVLHTLQQLINLNVYDSAKFLKQEIQGNDLNFEEVLEEYVSDLANHFVQNPISSDTIIDQLLINNFFSFVSKVEEAKELQIVIHRNERKRLKELLVAHDEQQDAEDLRIAFERLERKELKKRLQEEEGSAQLVTSQRPSFSVGMMLRVAAILVVILIPAGIILFRNMSDSTSTGFAKNDSQSQVEDAQYAAAEDISGLLEIDLPVEDIKNVIAEIDSDLDRGQGYASEDDSKIEIRVVSKSKQLAYLKNKIDTIGRKIIKINSQIKQGTAHKNTLKELKMQTEQLQIVQRDCRELYEQIKKNEMHYEFTKTRLIIYSNNEIDLKRFTVREEINVDTYEKEYFLLKDDKMYFQLIIKN